MIDSLVLPAIVRLRDLSNGEEFEVFVTRLDRGTIYGEVMEDGECVSEEEAFPKSEYEVAKVLLTSL